MLPRVPLPRRKRTWLAWGFATFIVLIIASCGPTKLTLTSARITPRPTPATPVIDVANITTENWQSVERKKYQVLFQNEIYGVFPARAQTKRLSHKIIDENGFDGLAQIEEFTFEAFAQYADTTNSTGVLKFAVARPKTPTPKAYILYESFCPNHNTIPHTGISKPLHGGFSCDGKGVMAKTMRYVFGRYIATPPIKEILSRGYGVVAIYPPDFIPDNTKNGQLKLDTFTTGHDNPNTRLGAIAAWAWEFSRVLDILKSDARFSDSRFVVFGHSRYGKAALVAAAFDPRIDGVIAHQSGTGGASLNKNKKGEKIKDITKSYPHWFARSYQHFAGHENEMDIDQHMLLALIAPRPIFLGNARRDVWSDPNGAFLAAQGASPVYKLFDKTGLKQSTLKPFIPGAEISFWIRPGTHGIVKEDWPTFLAFLDAHFSK